MNEKIWKNEHLQVRSGHPGRIDKSVPGVGQVRYPTLSEKRKKCPEE